MSDKVQYSIVHSEDGNIAVQSTVKSFNLDHITSKDITSFYTNFSQFAAMDTGLLPVEGSGMLSIRTAGEYTQFAYQHKPGLYHVNWAAEEGARHASAYYLAQPYRIIICDMKEGNLLGARTFYSPYPITSPSQPLYHVNLPNINCRGYRGNGVGWICLYQNEDWSQLPLNERIVRFIERCSGVETYNDGNMSETDGTRFYSKHGKPDYTWDPIAWQEKSYQEGYEWTLDEDLWIPVLVTSMDEQGKHDPNGVPLTFADALVGDYKAYYYDEETTKPINAIIRPDKEISSNKVLSYFVRSYNISNVNPNVLLNDTFTTAEKIKENKSSAIYEGSLLDDSVTSHNNISENNDCFKCGCCEDIYDQSDYGGSSNTGDSICDGCLSEYYVYIDKLKTHFHVESEYLVQDTFNTQFYHIDHDEFTVCPTCDSCYGTYSTNEEEIKKVMDSVFTLDSGNTICKYCIKFYKEEETKKCDSNCTNIVVPSSTNIFPTVSVSVPYIDEQGNPSFKLEEKTFCSDCTEHTFVCPCGIIKSSSDEDFNACDKSVLITQAGSTVMINKACASCVQFTFEQDNISATYKPNNPDMSNAYLNSNPKTSLLVNQGWNFQNYVEDVF